MPELAQSTATLSTWDHIDELTEAELDAWLGELNILWYDTGASLDTKRALVKDSDLVYKRLGTKWAVENVINSYFGEGLWKNGSSMTDSLGASASTPPTRACQMSGWSSS